MRVIVTGDRHWECRDVVRDLIRQMKASRHHSTIVVVHGDCPTGVDRCFEDAVRRYGNRDHGDDFPNIITEPHPALWDAHGRAAGPIRNGEMAEAGARYCLALHRNLGQSRGTQDTVKQCLQALIPVYLVDRDDIPVVPRRIYSVTR